MTIVPRFYCRNSYGARNYSANTYFKTGRGNTIVTRLLREWRSMIFARKRAIMQLRCAVDGSSGGRVNHGSFDQAYSRFNRIFTQ
jgi:hypothetical protein